MLLNPNILYMRINQFDTNVLYSYNAQKINSKFMTFFI